VCVGGKLGKTSESQPPPGFKHSHFPPDLFSTLGSIWNFNHREGSAA
jgi:hypothetical protein